MEMDADPGRAVSPARRGFVVASAALLAVALALCVWFGAPILLLTFAGILLAIFLHAPAGWLSRVLRLPLPLAVFLVILGGLGLLAAAVWLLAPSMEQQIERVSVELPRSIEHARQRLQNTWIGRFVKDGLPLSQLNWQAVVGQAAGVLTTVAGALAGIGIFLFVGLFVAIHPRVYEEGLLLLVPPARRGRAREILDELGSRLRRWLFGRLVGMAFIGSAVTVGLLVLNAPLALALGLIAAFFSFIPNLGPLLGAAPGVLLASTQGWTQVALVVAMYVVVELLDNNLVTPLIEQRAVYVPPALTIFSQLVAGFFFGLLGLFLATPLTACAMILVRRLYVEDVLGEKLP